MFWYSMDRDDDKAEESRENGTNGDDRKGTSPNTNLLS